MIRKFNYTGRKRIARSRISVEIIFHGDGPPSFEASVDLEGLDLPAQARVFIEVYRRYYFRRFHFGTVARLVPPQDRRLEDIDPGALVLFRVKVVETVAKGRILAAADRVLPQRTEDEPVGKISLLPVDFVDLGGAVWRLDLEGDWPSLQLNSRVDNIREIARTDSRFFALVYPEVVRQVLYQVVVVEDYTDPEGDPEDWMSLWLRFAWELLGQTSLPPAGGSESVNQAKLKWIEDVVEAFCAENRTRERYIQAQSGGGP